MKSVRGGLTSFIASLLGVCILLSLPGPSKGPQARPEKIAEVNGEKITRRELENRARIQDLIRITSIVPPFAEFITTTRSGNRLLEKYREFVLNILIEEEIIFQKAKEKGLMVNESEIENRIHRIIDQSNQVSDKTELRAKIQQKATSFEQLRDRIRGKLLEEKLRDLVTENISVSEAEVKDYYRTHKSSFRSKEGVIRKLEEVEAIIREKLRREKESRIWKQWLEKAKQQAEVKRLLAE